MKINYQLNNENIIIGWTRTPFNAKLPTLDIADPSSIQLGIDKIINNQLVKGTPINASINSEIQQCKAALASTDYKCLKYIDGDLSLEEYAPIKAQRQAWRDRINELEKQL